MMKSKVLNTLCTLILVYVGSGVHCLPLNIAILHAGKRSADLEPKLQETQYQDTAPLQIIPRYLDQEYEIIEDESPFRRNEPEVPTKVAHMFGRTLDYQDPSSALIETYGDGWYLQPLDGEPVYREEIIESPKLVKKSKYPPQYRRQKNSRYLRSHNGPRSYLYGG